MSLVEKLKLCIYCGADVTHDRRHKNRYGQYVCLPCRATHRERPSRHRGLRHGVRQWRRWVVYVLAAGLGTVLFYHFLGFVVEAMSSSRPAY